jgi:hypothetical protein
MRYAIVGTLGGVVALGAYQLYSLVTEWPEPCERMLQLAAANADVAKHTGLPLRRDQWWDGSVTSNTVVARVGLSGPTGKALLRGQAVKQPGTTDWHLMNCEVSLLADGAAPGAGAVRADAGLEVASRRGQAGALGEGVVAVVDVLKLGRQLSADEMREPWFVEWAAKHGQAARKAATSARAGGPGTATPQQQAAAGAGNPATAAQKS